MEERDIKATVVHIEDEQPKVRKPELAAPEVGKVWRRKYDGLVFYGAVYLGKRFVSYTGKPLKTPVDETPEDYIVIDMPELN